MNRNAINRNAIGRRALRGNARSPLIACIAIALLAALACGRYGPPRRVEHVPAAAAAGSAGEAVPAGVAVPAGEAVPADPAVPAGEVLPPDGTTTYPVEPDLEP